jgi:hypothetical protein
MQMHFTDRGSVMTPMDESCLGMKCGLVDIRMTRARGNKRTKFLNF